MRRLTLPKIIPAILTFAFAYNLPAFSTITEEVIFKNGDVRLHGTLFIPDTMGNFPALIVCHGSGREHRKLPGMRSIAQMYANTGYTTLLFDKRGVGDSDGRYIETPDFVVAAGDIIAAVNFMKTRRDVDRRKIGLYGHSQAGWTMPLASIACEDISFMIVSCGGGVSPLQQGIYHHYTAQQLGKQCPQGANRRLTELSDETTNLSRDKARL